ncbi:MAG: LPS-assembly protein LptD [Hyphomicrobiaceae bacterium]|nr:LPS-assembly protein LptD [Hyphomicrobiaceae bacterium]
MTFVVPALRFGVSQRGGCALSHALFALLTLAFTSVWLSAPALAQDPVKLEPALGVPPPMPGGASPPAFNRRQKPFGKPPRIDKAKPLYLHGDELIYDNKRNRVTARGNVQIFFNNFILQADEVIYDQGRNSLQAKGNVILKDPNGGTTRGETITLTDDFRDGFIESLTTVAKDNTRITARRGIRKGGNTAVFEDGRFTPCHTTGNKPPLWCISARRIIHDEKAATITYRDAQFEVFGVPVAYTPWFQHADPTVKRKSGFLAPEFTYTQDLGLMTSLPYYFALSPHYDFTFHPVHSTTQGILWKGHWRHRLAFGSIKGEYFIKFGALDQDYTTLPSKNKNLDGWRGTVQTKGEFSLSSWWKFGWDVTVESDDTFRRFYKFDSISQTDRINRGYLVGLSERNYFAMSVYHFGGLLLTDNPVTESRVHPVIDWSYIYGNPVLGGELSWNVNAVSFSRDLTFTDATSAIRNVDSTTHRVAVDVNWRRRLIDRVGITYTPFANLRGDVASFENVVDPLSNTLIDSTSSVRGVASAGILAAYPWLAKTSIGTHVIEPLAQLIVRTAQVSQRHLPIEDARSLVFDDTNLFDVSKFSGYDRVETGTRANFGVQYTFQSGAGPYARILAGQSFHLAGNNPYAGDPGREPSPTSSTGGTTLFSPNSGLSTDRSDYVLGAYLAPSSIFRFIGQARFDESSLSLSRADVLATANYGPVALSLTYAFTDSATNVTTTGVDKQELSAYFGLRLAQHWWGSSTVRYDITAAEIRQTAHALTYGDECFVLTATYIETHVENATKDIRPDRAVMLRFQLKYIGDFRYKTNVLDHLTRVTQ